ncbi:hypothetical protein EVAR_90211_1 [Eumeta japonica]|uniref:Uncharacterized protein n=1 Tax=Eumeta variegata TaxID=151549 RepID=A0A4C1WYK1_EUMVA|nr:hypothetical protein EVAR_90211_1 [Eumeta japonica]
MGACSAYCIGSKNINDSRPPGMTRMTKHFLLRHHHLSTHMCHFSPSDACEWLAFLSGRPYAAYTKWKRLQKYAQTPNELGAGYSLDRKS